jgi:integrase
MASVRTRGKKYMALYRDRAGRQRSAGSYSTKREALRAGYEAEALEARGFDGQGARPPLEVRSEARRGKITVHAYAERWLPQHRLSATGRASYEQMLKHVTRKLGDRAVAELTPGDIRQFFRKLENEGELSGATIGHILTALRTMVRAAVADGLLRSDVTTGIKIEDRKAPEMIIATPAQARAIQEAIPEHYKLLVEALFATGMRYGEVMGLRPEVITVNHVSATIHVRRTIVEVDGKPILQDHGKSANATRSITIEKDLAERLIANAREGYVFRAARGGYLSRSNFRRLWKPAVAAAGLPDLRVHDARHSHISWLANDPSVPLAAVRARVGHASLETTSRYVHVIPKDLDPCLAAFSAALAAA